MEQDTYIEITLDLDFDTDPADNPNVMDNLRATVTGLPARPGTRRSIPTGTSL